MQKNRLDTSYTHAIGRPTVYKSLDVFLRWNLTEKHHLVIDRRQRKNETIRVNLQLLGLVVYLWNPDNLILL